MPQAEITETIAKAAGMEAWTWLQKTVQEKGDRSFSCPSEAYGVILEEFQELLDAVHNNKVAAVRIELKDLFVPCVFEMAAMAERDPGPARPQDKRRIVVDQTKAMSILTHLQLLLVTEKPYTSIHDILGEVGLQFLILQMRFAPCQHLKTALEGLALACLVGLASFEAGTLEW